MKKVLAVISMVFVLVSCTLFSVSADFVITHPDFRNATYRFSYGNGSSYQSRIVRPTFGGDYVFSLPTISDFGTVSELQFDIAFDKPIYMSSDIVAMIKNSYSFGWYQDVTFALFYGNEGIYAESINDYLVDGVFRFGFDYTLTDKQPLFFDRISFHFSGMSFSAFRITCFVFDMYDASPSAAIQGGDYQSPRPGMDEEVQGAEDDYNNAVDGALGGKSDQEIQQDVEDAADFDFDSLDQNSVSGVKSFMEGLLDVLGSDYMALLLFSCTMGVCIYVIGRKRGT